MNREKQPRRGDVYYADLNPAIGSEQGGVRPVLILQNDIGNRHSPTLIAAAITSRTWKRYLPTHVHIGDSGIGLRHDSVVLLEQLRTIDKSRLSERMGALDEKTMEKVDAALRTSIGLAPYWT
jgi:mRNA interferase MazF